ncbi:MAG TPA: hypothetical protein VGE20_14845 [Ramlibacter sp.]
MGSDTTVLDAPPAARCPVCGSEFPAATTACPACQGRPRGRGTRHPVAKAVIGVAWFGTAVVILWFFGSLAMAPWTGPGSTGTMLLPGGIRFDLTLGRGATPRCVVRVTRDGRSSEVVIMQTACSRIVAHRWLKANQHLPPFQGAALGVPYTIPAPPGAEETATRTRLLVSSLITVTALLAGAFLMLGSVAVATRLMTPRK